MNLQRFLIAAVAVCAVIYSYDYIVHNMLLVDMYRNTVTVWRPFDGMLIWPMLLSQLLFSLAFVFIFTRCYENKGYTEGVRYGLYVGLLLAAIDLGTYSYLPVPLILVGCWMVATMVKSIALGFVCSVFYRN